VPPRSHRDEQRTEPEQRSYVVGAVRRCDECGDCGWTLEEIEGDWRIRACAVCCRIPTDNDAVQYVDHFARRHVDRLSRMKTEEGRVSERLGEMLGDALFEELAEEPQG